MRPISISSVQVPHVASRFCFVDFLKSDIRSFEVGGAIVLYHPVSRTEFRNPPANQNGFQWATPKFIIFRDKFSSSPLRLFLSFELTSTSVSTRSRTPGSRHHPEKGLNPGGSSPSFCCFVSFKTHSSPNPSRRSLGPPVWAISFPQLKSMNRFLLDPPALAPHRFS